MANIYFIYNGKIYVSDEKIISPSNHSFRYGDGFFETMKMINGKIIFEDLHFERLFSSLKEMHFYQPEYFSKEYLLQQIKQLTTKNQHQAVASIRLTIFRGDGSWREFDNRPNYIIQSYSLPALPAYNNKGFSIDIYKGNRLPSDDFSHIKSNNYLPYVMASFWSRQNSLDDALLLNSYDRIVEASTSNIFIIQGNKIRTPALSEGCVAGVTRRYLLHCFDKENISYEEGGISTTDLLQADEMFLTNTGWHIQWIEKYRDKIYTNNTSQKLYKQFIEPIIERI